MWRLLPCLLALAAATGCSPAEPLTPVGRGRRIYLSNCIVCHNPDPAQAGTSGPPVAGASKDLLEARILRASYPPGYTPKRPTKAMLPLPHLAPYVDDLAAFLNSSDNSAAFTPAADAHR